MKYKYSLATLGLIFLTYYIWFRFIRKRLPKDIPFELSLFSLIMLLFICIIYIYIIYRIIKPKLPNVITLQLIKTLSGIRKALHVLDQVIKENRIINEKLTTFLIVFINILNNALIKNETYIYIMVFYSPRIFIIFILIMDVFIFDRLSLIYNFMLIGIIPIIIQYLIDCIKALQQYYFKILEDYLIEITSQDNDSNTNYFMDPSTIDYDDQVETELDIRYKYLTIKNFVEFQTIAITFNHSLYSYKCFHKSKRKDIISLSQTPYIIEIDVNYYLNILIQVSVIVDIIERIKKRKIIKKLDISIFSIYLAIWTYILLISLHTFIITGNENLLLMNFQDIIEPFSQTLL